MEVLGLAAEDGRLTPDELEERLEAALSARTLGELAVLTADLMAGPGMPGPATAEADEVLRIDQRGGAFRRTGRWVVPQRLELRSSWCDVLLDFTDADDARCAAYRPEHAWWIPGPAGRARRTVDADSLRVRYADVKIRPAAEPTRRSFFACSWRPHALRLDRAEVA